MENGRGPGHWLGLMLRVAFTALTVMVGRHKGHPTCKNPILLIPSGSLPEQVEEEDVRGTADPGLPGKMTIEQKY